MSVLRRIRVRSPTGAPSSLAWQCRVARQVGAFSGFWGLFSNHSGHRSREQKRVQISPDRIPGSAAQPVRPFLLFCIFANSSSIHALCKDALATCARTCRSGKCFTGGDTFRVFNYFLRHVDHHEENTAKCKRSQHRERRTVSPRSPSRLFVHQVLRQSPVDLHNARFPCCPAEIL